MWTFLRNRPEDVGLPPIEKYHGEPETLLDDEERGQVASEGSWKLIGEVFSSLSIWLLALAYFPVKLTRYALVFWGPSFVNESLGTTAFASAMTSACMPIGGLVGVVAAGYFSDRLFQRRRAPVIILAFLAAAAVITVALWRIDNIWVMGAFFFFVGLFLYGGDSMIAATAAVDYGTKRGAGAATGFVNGIGSLGAVVGAYLPGRLTTSNDWSLLFKISLVGMIVSAIILLPLWRHKPPVA
jgi:OPA family sugar phosphate sensor protein UhpC-like MFS transporter